MPPLNTDASVSILNAALIELDQAGTRDVAQTAAARFETELDLLAHAAEQALSDRLTDFEQRFQAGQARAEQQRFAQEQEALEKAANARAEAKAQAKQLAALQSELAALKPEQTEAEIAALQQQINAAKKLRDQRDAKAKRLAKLKEDA